MKATPELANWLTSLYPEKQVCPIAPPYNLNLYCCWATMLMNTVSSAKNGLFGTSLRWQLIVASYIYQDGEAFVRASLAMDAIVQALIERRSVAPGENITHQQGHAPVEQIGIDASRAVTVCCLGSAGVHRYAKSRSHRA